MQLQDSLKVKMSINSPHALSISRSIGKFIAVDMMPYSIVESDRAEIQASLKNILQ